MRVLVRDVMKAAAEQADLTLQELQGLDRSRRVVWPRMRAMYVARLVTGASLPQIGGFLNRDHTTVLHALRKLPDRMAEFPAERFMVHDLLARFAAPSVVQTCALVRAETEGLAA